MMRLMPALFIGAVVAVASAPAQENRGTPEQRAACAPDAFRLCSAYIPDPSGEACLRLRKSDLSEACKTVFEQASTGSDGTK
ncbi:hypothetical protein FNJ47_08165 [Bradyrhizobium sp. UFLA 03-164]|uniref:3',5'-cyclic-nucleotide phosphodiesterase n=1 Tax=Bradyrhizobium uaiense TaxID=2594946 RepID=A0A6P1BC73_9BRAD|nr:hypothetical protein [Bradyrhizobium uaiense]